MPGRKRTASTPSTDHVQETVEEAPTEVAPEQPVEVTPEAPEVVVTHDEKDVEALLDRDTQDGKGDDEVPESDFESYATEGVEKTKTVPEVASEILQGKWGRYGERRQLLKDAGYDPVQVESFVNIRLSSGAPSAHHPSLTEVAAQVLRGEWGSDREQRLRLEGAGHLHKYVMEEVARQQGG